MVDVRPDITSRHSWQELSPGLRDAVLCILNDPMPEDLTCRGVDAVRRRVARYPRNTDRRIMSWIGPAIAASIAFFAVAAYIHAGRGVRSPIRPAAGEHVATAIAVELPTAWAYMQAAGQSPQALDALLDRRTQQAIFGNSPFAARASVIPFASGPSGTVP